MNLLSSLKHWWAGAKHTLKMPLVDGTGVQSSSFQETSTIFLILLLAVFAKNGLMLTKFVLPVHDAFYAFNGFSFFYENAVLGGELPLWMPDYVFGVKSALAFHMFASPSELFVGFYGYLFSIKNTYLVFALGTILQDFLFALGAFCFCNLIYKKQATALIVALTALLSLVTLRSPFLYYQMFYLLPWSWFFITIAFRRQELCLLFVGLIFFVMSLLGTTGYTGGVQLIPILLYGWILQTHNRTIWRRFVDQMGRLNSIIWLIVLLGVSLVYLILLREAATGVKVVSPGRSLDSIFVPLEVFLNFGVHLSWNLMGDLIIPHLWDLDVPIFCGHLVLLSTLLGLKRMNTNRYALALIVVTVFVIFFARGKYGIIAPLLYFVFPPVKVYRHVGHVITYLALLLPLLAGFYLDDLIAQKRKGLALLVLLHFGTLCVYQGYIDWRLRQSNLAAVTFFNQHDLSISKETEPKFSERLAQQRDQFYRIYADTNSGATYGIENSYSQRSNCMSPYRTDFVNPVVFNYHLEKYGNRFDAKNSLEHVSRVNLDLGCDLPFAFSTLAGSLSQVRSLPFKKLQVHRGVNQFEVEATREGVIVVRDNMDKGWQLSSGALLREFLPFKAFKVNEGVSRVRLEYVNPTLKFAYWFFVFASQLTVFGLIYSFFCFSVHDFAPKRTNEISH